MCTSQNLDLFCQSISIFFSRLYFFPLPFFFISSFVAHFIVFLLHGIVAGQHQRVVGKQRNWQWIFPQNVTLFCKCNSVRICQNIQNDVSLERSIFADAVTYQFINFNWKLNGSREENMHWSIWNKNDQSSHRRVNCVCNKCELRSSFLDPHHWLLITHIMNIRHCRSWGLIDSVITLYLEFSSMFMTLTKLLVT